MKTYLITGAGTGIGEAAALRLAESGARIILAGRRLEPLEKVLSKLVGEGHHLLSVDVSNKSSLREGLKKVLDEGPLDGLFANAGIGGENRYGEEDRWEQMIDINLSGAYYTVMESLPYLKRSKEKYRNILITSSCLARFGVPYYTAYCASKSGLTGLVRALAVELAPSRMLVNAILPGWVDTAMAKKGMELLAGHTHKPFEQVLKEQMGFVPLQKMSHPDEIAAYVEFFFSNAQTSITGQCLDINNGSFMI
jgi:NAD(P)-dependent dehydrogenase (short-subunit alcohol dehydrogenase family)